MSTFELIVFLLAMIGLFGMMIDSRIPIFLILASAFVGAVFLIALAINPHIISILQGLV